MKHYSKVNINNFTSISSFPYGIEKQNNDACKQHSNPNLQ